MATLFVTVALTVAACGGDGDQLTGDRLADELSKSNLPDDVAACVAEELPDGLSRSAIEQQDDAEGEKFLNALGICSEKLAPEPDVSIPGPSGPEAPIPTTSVPSGG